MTRIVLHRLGHDNGAFYRSSFRSGGDSTSTNSMDVLQDKLLELKNERQSMIESAAENVKKFLEELATVHEKHSVNKTLDSKEFTTATLDICSEYMSQVAELAVEKFDDLMTNFKKKLKTGTYSTGDLDNALKETIDEYNKIEPTEASEADDDAAGGKINGADGADGDKIPKSGGGGQSRAGRAIKPPERFEGSSRGAADVMNQMLDEM